jgi:hypothetical protein
MVRMDARDIEGDKEYNNTLCSFNTSFTKVLSNPKLWGNEFVLVCINTKSAAGNKYSQVTIDESVTVEA